jgi:DNA-binding ferritin-like protein
VSPLRQNLTDLLATLRAIHWHAWNTHWKSKGGDSYSDHLLFQRIYEGSGGGPKIEDQIDGLGERMIALFGNDAVDGINISKKATRIHEGIKGLGMVAGALKLEKEALAQAARIADAVVKGPADLRIGLDNFVRELADARSTVVYLLQQRLKGGSDTYGAFVSALSNPGEGEISPYVSALFPVVLSAGVGGLIAGATGKFDPKQGAMAGASLGVVWSVMQMRKQDEQEEVVEIVEMAKPNNVFQLDDYRGVDLGDAGLTTETKSNLLGWAMMALLGGVAYWNYRQAEYG